MPHRPDVDPAVTRRSRSRMVLRGRPRRPFLLRTGVQLLTLLVIVVIGVQFANWVANLEAGRIAGARPPGVEGFLPISALLSLRQWLAGGGFSMVHPAGLVLLGLICLSALLLKKSFCSWLCPVGTLSEALARASHLVLRRRVKLPRWLDLGLMSLKYVLIAYFLFAVFLQMTLASVALFIDSPYNRIADIKMLHFFTRMSPTTAWVLGGLALLSFLVPYFWCRYLCPYGALLGVLSRFSPLKVVRSAPDCTNCGRCAAVCPSYLAVDLGRTVTSPECTGCLECVTNCPAPGALEVRGPAPWRRRVRPAVFAAAVLLVFFGGIGAAKLAGRWRTEITDQEYLRRVQEIDSPKYHHARGQVPEYGPQD
ncbi:MAG: 4Fe-4S binding protein [Candidatus Latescibacteria bacterium]|nr:4Fe-4S binding protein [Candidatus Latescibacterota bacterium]